MTGVSSLGQALAQIERIKDQQSLFSNLNTQLATGKNTQIFSGLETNVLTSKRARADLGSLDTYINNITNADRRIELMLNAIEEFKAQAENFANALVGFSQQSTHQEGEVVYWDDPTTPDTVENIPLGMSTATPDIEFETLQDLANNIFDFLGDLLNAQEGDRYLLGGAETLVAPLNLTGTLDTAISSLIDDWKTGTITTTDLIADLEDRSALNGNPNAITDSIIGFNSTLASDSAGDIFVRVSDTSEIDYTVLANDQAFRDILVAVSYFKSEGLPPIADEVEIDPNTGLPTIITEGAPGDTTDEMKDNFFEVFNNLSAMINRAIDDIDQQRFKLENARVRIAETKRNHENEQNILLNTISDVENADINEVAIRINSLQVQLDASFRVTARLQELSLVNFI